MNVKVKDTNYNTVAIYKTVELSVKEATHPKALYFSHCYNFALSELIEKRNLPIDYSDNNFIIEYSTELDKVVRLTGCKFNKNSFTEGETYILETINKSKYPRELKPVLAEIHSQGSLGLSKWHEVVYYDSDIRYCWCSYAGSNTFNKGEQVVAWEYVDNIKLSNTVD